MEDEIDPIVEEIDAVLVFPRGKLYVLDYPVPSAAGKYFNPKSAKVRPRHTMMEVVYDTSDWMKSQFFDKAFVSGIDKEAYGERKFSSTSNCVDCCRCVFGAKSFSEVFKWFCVVCADNLLLPS